MACDPYWPTERAASDHAVCDRPAQDFQHAQIPRSPVCLDDLVSRAGPNGGPAKLAALCG